MANSAAAAADSLSVFFLHQLLLLLLPHGGEHAHAHVRNSTKIVPFLHKNENIFLSYTLHLSESFCAST